MKLKFRESLINVTDGFNASPGDVAEVADEAEAKRYIEAGIAEEAGGKEPVTAASFTNPVTLAQKRAEKLAAERAKAAKAKAAKGKERAEAPDKSEKAVAP